MHAGNGSSIALDHGGEHQGSIPKLFRLLAAREYGLDVACHHEVLRFSKGGIIGRGGFGDFSGGTGLQMPKD
jgi:hypothetical protein